MEVVGHGLWLDAEEGSHALDHLAVGDIGLQVRQVADVRAHEGVRPARQTDGALELGAAGQDGPRLERQPHRERRVAARTPDRQLAPRREAGHRVVAADVDRPVVEQEGVGDPAEPRERVGVVGGDGLLAPVAARHHERLEARRRPPEEQVVQRRVRKHHAEPAEPRRHRRRRCPNPRRARRRTMGRAGEVRSARSSSER